MPGLINKMRSTCVTAVILIAICTIIGCQQSNETPKHGQDSLKVQEIAQSKLWPTDARRTDKFVGSLVCRECHIDLYDRYQAHPMAIATVPADAINLPEFQPEAMFEAAQRRYSVKNVDSQMVHAESGLARDGNEYYHQSVPVQYAIGSGRRGFSFVINHDGLLYQSPLTWYTRDQKWNLSPGYDPHGHPRFERRISDGCITCHIGQSRPVPGSYHRYQPDEPFLELGIGCERCHGPGNDHVQFHFHGTGSDSIVNPEALFPPRRESVCYQCHLHGETRILRENRTEFDFRAGDLISDIWTVFAKSSSIQGEETVAVSQVEQIVASKCFTESGGKFGCTSCHDPHSIPQPAERITFYRQKCLKCHGVGNAQCKQPEPERLRVSQEDSCIECHMPSLSASDVPHTSQTDHRILPRPSFRERSLGKKELTLFEPQDFPVDEMTHRRASALALANLNSEGHLEAIAKEIQGLIDSGNDDSELLKTQAEILFQLHEKSGMKDALKAHEVAPENEAILRLLAQYSEVQGDTKQAMTYIEKAIELNPHSSDFWQQKARLHYYANELDQADQAALKVLEINPRSKLAREITIKVADKQGRGEDSRKHQEIMQELGGRFNTNQR